MKRRSLPYQLKNNKALVAKLSRVNKLSFELHKMTTQAAIGEILGVSKQAISYQAKKEAERE